MSAFSDACIINVGNGQWYPRGSRRLKRSLKVHSYKGELLYWIEGYPPGSPPHAESPYAFKPFAFAHARKLGYQKVLWCDSSLYCTKDPAPVFRHMEEQGHYFIDNGYNCAQTCTDRALLNCGCTRDEAERMPELSGCFMGLDFAHEVCHRFLDEWLERAQDGSFCGAWTRNEKDSKDPRFLFARHDQSVASLIANRLGMSYTPPGLHFSYYREDLPESVCFVNQGM